METELISSVICIIMRKIYGYMKGPQSSAGLSLLFKYNPDANADGVLAPAEVEVWVRAAVHSALIRRWPQQENAAAALLNATISSSDRHPDNK